MKTTAKLPMSLSAVLAIRTAEMQGYDGADIARLAETIALGFGYTRVDSWHVDDALEHIIAGLSPDDDCFC